MFKLFKRFVLIFLILSIFLPASVHAEGGKFLVHGTVYRGQDMPAPGWRPRGAEIVVYTTTDGAVLGTTKSGENGAYSLSFTVVDDQQVKVVAEETIFGSVGRAELVITVKADGLYQWSPHLGFESEPYTPPKRIGKFLVHGTVYRGQDMPAPGWRPRGAEIVVYTTTDGAVLGTAKSGENGAYSLSFTVVDDQQVKVVAEESFFGGVVGRAELTLTTKVDGFYNWTPHLELNKEWIPSWMSPR